MHQIFDKQDYSNPNTQLPISLSWNLSSLYSQSTHKIPNIMFICISVRAEIAQHHFYDKNRSILSWPTDLTPSPDLPLHSIFSMLLVTSFFNARCSLSSLSQAWGQVPSQMLRRWSSIHASRILAVHGFQEWFLILHRGEAYPVPLQNQVPSLLQNAAHLCLSLLCITSH